jgi:hypothetical protein
VLHLQYTSRENPDTPLEDIAIEEDLYRIGAKFLNHVAKTNLDAEKLRPTIKDLHIVIGHLGGFSFQKGKNMGPKTLRCGLVRLPDIRATAYALSSG